MRPKTNVVCDPEVMADMRGMTPSCPGGRRPFNHRWLTLSYFGYHDLETDRGGDCGIIRVGFRVVGRGRYMGRLF